MGEVTWKEGSSITLVKQVTPEVVGTILKPELDEMMMESSQHRQTKNRNDLESRNIEFVATSKLCRTNIIFQY